MMWSSARGRRGRRTWPRCAWTLPARRRSARCWRGCAGRRARRPAPISRSPACWRCWSAAGSGPRAGLPGAARLCGGGRGDRHRPDRRPRIPRRLRPVALRRRDGGRAGAHLAYDAAPLRRRADARAAGAAPRRPRAGCGRPPRRLSAFSLVADGDADLPDRRARSTPEPWRGAMHQRLRRPRGLASRRRRDRRDRRDVDVRGAGCGVGPHRAPADRRRGAAGRRGGGVGAPLGGAGAGAAGARGRPAPRSPCSTPRTRPRASPRRSAPRSPSRCCSSPPPARCRARWPPRWRKPLA